MNPAPPVTRIRHRRKTRGRTFGLCAKPKQPCPGDKKSHFCFSLPCPLAAVRGVRPPARNLRRTAARSPRRRTGDLTSARGGSGTRARPSRQNGSLGASGFFATQHRVGGAGRGGAPSSAVVIGTTRHSSFASSKIAWANSAHVHSPSAAKVPDPVRQLDKPRESPRRGWADVGRAADLVVDDRKPRLAPRPAAASSARSCDRSGRRAMTSGRSRPARPRLPRRRPSSAPYAESGFGGFDSRYGERFLARRRHSRSSSRRAARAQQHASSPPTLRAAAALRVVLGTVDGPSRAAVCRTRSAGPRPSGAGTATSPVAAR